MCFVNTYKIPVWAIPYLEYGNEAADSLLWEDIEEIDSFIENNFPNGYVINYPEDIDSAKYFSPLPDIGSGACDVVNCEIYEP